MTPANESGLPVPEEPEPLQDSPAQDAAVGAEPAGGGAGGPGGGAESAADDRTDPAERTVDTDAAGAAGPDGADADPDLEAAARFAAEAESEAARERAAFDELVASFHTETAPDPVPRKIIRHPVLNTEPVWEQPILEPTDETTVDKYFPSEHFEPPEPPPLPEASGATKASWTLLIGGVLFLILRTLFQWQTEQWMFWVAVSAVFGGIVALVVRMQPDRDDYDDPDNGAVV